MPVKITNKEFFINHIRNLGLSHGDDIVVHSRLFSFGHIEGGVQMIYESLREIVGDSATIVVPTYRLVGDPSEVFDPQSSPSRNVGKLSEYVRKLAGSKRSLCPLHSHAAIGPKAILLENVSGDVSYGAGSDFDIFIENDFKYIFLGVDFPNAATLMVHVLASVGGIPYRNWIEIPKNIKQKSGIVVSAMVRYYARKPGFDEDFSCLQEIFESRGHLQQEACCYGTSFAFMAKCFFDTLKPVLQKNPTLFLRK